MVNKNGVIVMRKTKSDAELSKSTILEAAYAIFLKEGYEKTTLNMIAQSTGMTRGAIYWHFKDKEDLYIQVLTTTLDSFEYLRTSIQKDPHLSVKEKLYQLFVMVIEMKEKYAFVNRIEYYLPNMTSLKPIVERMKNNRTKFVQYLESSLTQFEEERGIKFTQDKQSMAEMLYLLYEGLHFCDVSGIFNHKMDSVYVMRYIDYIVER